MEEVIQVALWVGGIFLLIISGLLGWIGVMQRETKKVITLKNDEQDKRLERHDLKFDEQQKEIHALALQNSKTLTILERKFKK